jgi:prepilin-type N-terminal cleavage/methylation domain-containing protein
MKLKIKKDGGFTLIELLIAAAVGSTALYFVGSSLNMLRAGSQKIESVSNINDFKSIVTGLISCQRTFASLPARPPCSGSGMYIDIIGRPEPGFPGGKPIIDASGSQYGGWTLRALCTSKGIDIRGAKIREEYLGEKKKLTDWRGSSSPSKPDKYVSDHLLGGAENVYSWAHPLAKISSPGPLGLCSEIFSAPAVSNDGCEPGQYLKEINLITGTKVCKDIPACSPPTALAFNGSDLYCSDQLFNSIQNQITTNRNSQIGPMNKYVSKTLTDLNNQATKVYNTLFQVFNPANDIVLERNTKAGCKDNDMRCPNGWVMTSYEFRYDTSYSQICSMNCREIAP